jgi:hypothetical protein
MHPKADRETLRGQLEWGLEPCKLLSHAERHAETLAYQHSIKVKVALGQAMGQKVVAQVAQVE